MFENEVAIFENGHLDIKDGVKYLENKLLDTLREHYISYSDVEFVSLPDSLEYIDPGFFAYTSISEIILPNGIKSIENSTFYNCHLLKSIIISTGIQSIGSSAFEKCVRLEKIILPNSLVQILSRCFYGCSRLSKITIPESVEHIGQFVFNDCTDLKEIRVPRRLSERYRVDFIRCNTNAEVIPNDAPIVKVYEDPKEVVVASEVVEKSASIKCYNGVIKKSLLPGRKNQSKGFSGNFKK